LAGVEHESFAVDDQVEIGIPEEALMQGVFWVYILPLLGLFSGGVAAIQCFGPGDLQAIIGAALGFVLSLLAVRRFLSKSRHACAFAPVLLGKSVADVNVVRIVSSVGH
jgi:sigma-E factor negative regulatory protein RseC